MLKLSTLENEKRKRSWPTDTHLDWILLAATEQKELSVCPCATRGKTSKAEYAEATSKSPLENVQPESGDADGEILARANKSLT